MFDLDLLSERARVSPDKTALVSVQSGERLTYAELAARAAGTAAQLLAFGLAPGDRFGLLAHNANELVIVFFAALKARLIVVPLSTRATAHELNAIVADCSMRLVVVGPEFESMTLDVPKHPIATIACEHVGELTQTEHVGDEELACLLYTSGTTGKPKGVMIPRRQLFWNGYNTAINWDLRADDVSPIFTPLYHAGGIAAFLIPIFSIGGTVVIHRSFDTTEVWRTVERERCTVVLGVPTIWKLLMDAPELASTKLDHVRWFISGGAPLPTYLIDAYQRLGVPFKQGYGMTEVGVNCFTMTVDESYRKPGSIGRPMLFTEARLVGEDGREARAGETGELQIRGPHVSRGYWNNDAATRASYGDDGWFRTGDVARRDADGFFYIAGRQKDMFISGGVNVYPAEIEAALVTHPGIADAAVIAIADEIWGEVGIAFIVLADAVVSCEEIEAYLAPRLAKYKLPRRYVVIEALPRTPYGKVVKSELQQLIAEK